MDKQCSSCKKFQSSLCFYRDKKSKDGYAYICKICTKRKVKKWRDYNSEKVSAYYKAYQKDKRKELKEYRKQYYLANRETLINKSKERYHSDLEKSKLNRSNWRARNKDYTKRHSREYKRKRRLNDVDFKITEVLRSRLNSAVKGKIKSGSSISNLGCSIEELRQHLENQFQPGMSWENYGNWHIDHIVPLSFFDLTEEMQLKDACYFTNLQPLWAEDNLRKGAKLCGF